MFWRFCVILFFGALLEWKLTHCAPVEVGKSKEKVRAYEFGYSIEESQHRHEKRDENGIVMGEFGFITADGIYHVTVYATDENGKFKILAMKSYPYGNPEKKTMLTMLPPPKKPVVYPMIKQLTPLDVPSCGGCVLTKKLSPADVNKQTPQNPEAVFRTLSKTLNDVPGSTRNVPFSSGVGAKGAPLPPPRPPLQPNGFGLGSSPSLSSKPNGLGSSLKPNQFGSTLPKATGPGTALNGKNYQLTNFQKTGQPTQPLAGFPANRQGKAFTQTSPQQIGVRLGGGAGSQNFPSQSQFQRNPSSPGGSFNTNNFAPNTATVTQQNAKDSKFAQPPNKFLSNGGFPSKSAPPSINGAQLSKQNTIQPLTKNTLSQGRLPTPATVPTQFNANNAFTRTQLTPTGLQQQYNSNGARTQTPNIPSTKKLSPLTPSTQSIGKATPSNNGGGPLYRFKYVLDYNSHHEEGRLDGSKQGNYKTLDEDGIRRIIDYIANENGYQPHIKWERVQQNELPTGENKLRDYEFVWFNQP